MKRFVVFAILLFYSTVNAQMQLPIQTKSLGIGANIGGNLFFGDSRVLNSKIGLNSGIYGIYQVSPRLDLKLQIGYGKFGIYRNIQIQLWTIWSHISFSEQIFKGSKQPQQRI